MNGFQYLAIILNIGVERAGGQDTDEAGFFVEVIYKVCLEERWQRPEKNSHFFAYPLDRFLIF